MKPPGTSALQDREHVSEVPEKATPRQLTVAGWHRFSTLDPAETKIRRDPDKAAQDGTDSATERAT